MKSFKKPDGSIWAFEDDGSQDHLITEDMTPYSYPEPPSPKIVKINYLQGQYEIDRNKLNQAWLSAIIADGEQETARKAIISTQMADLQTKLQADIAAILSEA